ncbi:unnamed protein product [Eruca vesicaria subsp. sativa]|uniref:Uncharacterized protein n=1 Tax=Eruca vesicaria subsp. sativa TaxID=29727 RepID=A0ABC8LDG3_ERUVS|nr:unnamed protein product [Eruca vesicaria subsp. sativa]
MDPFYTSFSDSFLSIPNHRSPISDSSECYPKKRAGRKKFRETRHPINRGVRQRNSGKYVCEVREPNKKKGSALRGRYACLNFADSAWHLRIPESNCPKEIQKAATEAAMAFQNETATTTAAETAGQKIGETAEQSSVFYLKEEAVLGMPRFFENMGEEIYLPPSELGWNHNDLDGESDVSLWNLRV